MVDTDQLSAAMAATDQPYAVLNLAVMVVCPDPGIKEDPDHPSDNAAASMVAQGQDGEQ